MPAAIARSSGESRDPRLPLILLYHSISDSSRDPWGVRVAPERFAEHMKILASVFAPMRLRDVDAALKADSVPPRSVVVTFDDGYIDNLLVAKPVMQRHSVPGTVFVASGYVGNENEYWWDDLDRLLLQRGRLPRDVSLSLGERTMHWNLGADAWLHWPRWRLQRRNRFYAYQDSPEHVARHTPRQRMYVDLWRGMRSAPSVAAREIALRDLRCMTRAAIKPRESCRCCSADQVRELAAGGLIEIGAHTVNHPSLGHINAEEQRHEIFESRNTLQSILQQPVESFAFPFGEYADYSSDTIHLLKQAGYKQACINANPRSAVTRDVNRYEYPRVIVGDWDGSTFTARMHEWFDRFGHAPA